MTGYQLSLNARQDLRGISSYSRRRWGREQADRYIRGLMHMCELLAEHPLMGRALVDRPALRRMEQESHIIIYSVEREKILIGRILHKNNNLELHRY